MELKRPAPFGVEFAARTHPGLRRALNEDHLACLPGQGVWVIADGMGGEHRGDHASRSLVEAMARMPTGLGPQSTMAELNRRIADANARLFAEGAAAGRTIATTVVCLLISGLHFAALWVGDSRLLLVRRGVIHRLTVDHSVVQELVDDGLITPDTALGHPRENELTRAVGAEAEVCIDARQGVLEDGDTFVLCSDGVTKVLDDAAILAHVLGATDPETVVETVLRATLDAGAPDNVSIIFVRCRSGVPQADEETVVGLAWPSEAARPTGTGIASLGPEVP
jgi:serine/threonine protein phosphatase PrpC